MTIPSAETPLVAGTWSGGWKTRTWSRVNHTNWLAVLDLFLYMDASNIGWGASLFKDSVSGLWDIQERSLHSNVLEIRAIRLGLHPFAEMLKDCCSCFLRQCHSTHLPQQGRRYPFYTTQQGGTGDFRLGRDSFGADSGSVCKWIRHVVAD